MSKNNRLVGRKCSCGRDIKAYTLVGLYLPVERRGLYYFNQFGGRDENRAFINFGKISLTEVFKLCFLSECPCGKIEYWSLNREEIDFLVTNEDGYYLEWVYNNEIWTDFKNKTGDENLKGEIDKVLEMITRSYESKNG